MALTQKQRAEAAVWIERISQCGENLQDVLQILDEFLDKRLPYYSVLDHVYEKVKLLDPSLETVSGIWKKLNRKWQFWPDHGYGFWDTVLDGEDDSIMDGTYSFVQLSEELSSRAAGEATDFYAALYVLSLFPNCREAEEKLHEFASTPEHALAWLALNENGNICTYSERDQKKFRELATRDDVRLEMLRQGAFSDHILREIEGELEYSGDPVTKYALRTMSRRRR